MRYSSKRRPSFIQAAWIMAKESEYGRRAIIARIHEQLDLSWNESYKRFLDFSGREPRPVDKRSFTIISAFFLVSWGVSTWQGLSQMIPAIASTTIVSLASLRFNEFDRAYRRYRQRRIELTHLTAMPLILLEQQLLLPSAIPAGNLPGHLAREVARMFLEYCHQLRSFRLRELGERLWKR
jgi:hypothetical protein